MTADFDDLITSGQASALTGRSPGTIILWIALGHITPVHTAGRTRRLRREDVLKVAAEKDAHPVNAGRRRSAQVREAATA